MRNIISFKFSDDLGKLYENAVFLELLRQEKEIYYYRDKTECDFLIKEGKDKKVIQVCFDITEPETKEREINGLCMAMEKFNLKTGIIITSDFETKEKINNKTIKFIPLWKWLLQGK